MVGVGVFLCRSSDHAIKLWWNKKTEEEKAEWNQTHYGVDSSQGKEAGMEVERSETKTSGSMVNDQDLYIAYVVFRRHLLLETKDEKKIQQAWSDKCRNDLVPRITKNGETWIFDTTVLQVNRYDKDETSTSTRCGETVGSVAELDAARAAGDADREKLKRKRELAAAPVSAMLAAPKVVGGGARCAKDLQSFEFDYDSLATHMAELTEEQHNQQSLIQELADIDEQDLQIFRVEAASEIEANAPSKSVSVEQKKLKTRILTFMNGTFATKVETTIAEAADLIRQVGSHFPDKDVEGTDWRDKLAKVRLVANGLAAVRATMTENVEALTKKIEGTAKVDELDPLSDEWDGLRGQRFVEYKVHGQAISNMLALVKKAEAKLRDDGGSVKKKKKGDTGVPDIEAELTVAEKWKQQLLFLSDSFANQNPKVNCIEIAAEHVGTSPCLSYNEAFGKELAGHAVLKALLKWCEQQCADGTRSAMAASVSQANHRAKVEMSIAKGGGLSAEVLFPRPSCATEPWLSDLFVPQACYYAKGHSSCSLAPFGLPIGLAPLEGSCVVSGFQLSSIPGDTLLANTEHIKGLTVDGLTTALKAPPSFFAQLSVRSVLYVPAGFVIVVYTAEAHKTLRWSYFSPTETSVNNAISFLSMMMHAQPSLTRLGAYPKLLDWLKGWANST